ncbi:MAG: hypothetical protein HY741_01985 [Chloroflexi bacterium]|nr:hypothetical protein [Chloroflexota bacterium]
MKKKLGLLGAVCTIVVLTVIVWIFFVLGPGVVAQSGQGCGNIPPASIGIRYGQASSPSRLRQSDAIRLARGAATVATTGAQINARFVLFSNDNLFYTSEEDATEDSQKTFLYRDRPAWIVSFCGLHIRSRGRPRDQNQMVNSELNIVVDADTGEILQEFTYR